MTEEIVLTRCLFLGGHIGPPLRLVLLFRVIVGADRRVCPLLFALSLFAKRESFLVFISFYLLYKLYDVRNEFGLYG